MREHLANERTLLAWVRTGVGLISVGFVVERVGALAAGTPGGQETALASEVFGLALWSLWDASRLSWGRCSSSATGG